MNIYVYFSNISLQFRLARLMAANKLPAQLVSTANFLQSWKMVNLDESKLMKGAKPLSFRLVNRNVNHTIIGAAWAHSIYENAHNAKDYRNLSSLWPKISDTPRTKIMETAPTLKTTPNVAEAVQKS